jgi:RNA polymerase sigma-70 factor (ECF subfamily)
MMTVAATPARDRPRSDRRPPEVDEVTVRRAQRGEADAVRAVVERYHRAVHALVWRMSAARTPDRVDDLVQDCFVRVLRGLAGFDPRGTAKLSTWILTIATRVVLNDRRRPPAAELAEEPAAPRGDEPAAAVDRARLARAIGDAVSALPEAQRAVLVLREYHDLDYAEIAQALEVDLGTVKSRLARARTAVREHLERALPDRFGGSR